MYVYIYIYIIYNTFIYCGYGNTTLWICLEFLFNFKAPETKCDREVMRDTRRII